MKSRKEAIQELLDWNICERNYEAELKPTTDFTVWYYDYLIHEIVETYGENWEDTITGKETEKDWDEMDEGDKERNEFVKDCIRNQISTWTIQRIGNECYAKLDTDEHVNILYGLYNEINERLMDVHSKKLRNGKDDK